MRKDKLKFKNCWKITAIVILLSFLKPSLMFAQQQTEPSQILNEGGTRLYSDLEIDYLAELDTLIDEISEAALEAIEQAAGEAARAAVLSMLERELIALGEANRWRMEAEANLQAIALTKQAGRKNIVLGVVIGILGGLALGVGGTLIIGGR